MLVYELEGAITTFYGLCLAVFYSRCEHITVLVAAYVKLHVKPTLTGSKKLLMLLQKVAFLFDTSCVACCRSP